MYVPRFNNSGLGSTSSTVESTVSTAAGIAATLAKMSKATGPAAPFFEIAAGVASLLGALGVGSGCGQTCIVASDYANKAEAQMKQNLAAWQALSPDQKTKSIQALALQNYDQLWAGLVQFCSNSQLGDAGRRCISDRDRSGKYPWAVYYRDPISNDSVIDDSAALSLYSAVAPGSSVPTPIVWLEQNWDVALAITLAWFAISDSSGKGRK